MKYFVLASTLFFSLNTFAFQIRKVQLRDSSLLPNLICPALIDAQGNLMLQGGFFTYTTWMGQQQIGATTIAMQTNDLPTQGICVGQTPDQSKFLLRAYESNGNVSVDPNSCNPEGPSVFNVLSESTQVAVPGSNMLLAVGTSSLSVRELLVINYILTAVDQAAMVSANDQGQSYANTVCAGLYSQRR